MRYSIESQDGIHVKDYGYLSFPKKMGKGISNKCGYKKTGEATSDLTGNKIADELTSLSKKFTTELHSKELPKD